MEAISVASVSCLLRLFPTGLNCWGVKKISGFSLFHSYSIVVWFNVQFKIHGFWNNNVYIWTNSYLGSVLRCWWERWGWSKDLYYLVRWSNIQLDHQIALNWSMAWGLSACCAFYYLSLSWERKEHNKWNLTNVDGKLLKWLALIQMPSPHQ